MSYHLEILIISDTYAKRTTEQSADLPSDRKVLHKAGDRLIPVKVAEARFNHVWFLPVEESDSQSEEQGWFLFREHITINQVYENGSVVGVDGSIRTPAPALEQQTESYLISLDRLGEIAVHCPTHRLALLIDPLNAAMQRYAINTPLRIAHFIAQVAHESDGFNTNEEYASGDDYEWRDDLGNIYEGDGRRFKGRGLIQVTGRTNYAECGLALGANLIKTPERLADFDLACLSAGWYWDKMQLNLDADADDILTITRLINGGYNGLSDRRDYLARAKSVMGLSL
jgi:predicted chitinase